MEQIPFKLKVVGQSSYLFEFSKKKIVFNVVWNQHHGPLRPSLEVDDNTLLRIDFVREVDELLQDVRSEQDEEENEQELNAESVANILKQQEKQQTIRQVEALLDLAISLNWQLFVPCLYFDLHISVQLSYSLQCGIKISMHCICSPSSFTVLYFSPL